MSSRPKLPLSKREILFAFLASLAICLAIQVHGTAFSTDLSAHPDEPAHAVTGLMIRDYLAGGFLESNNPMAFAQNYYDRFPKVALGHYPPAFYILESVWLLPARSIPACIALIAALATTLLTLCYICIRKSFPDLPSLAAFLPAAAVPFVPMVGNSLVMVMSDLMLAVCCLGATMAFAKFAEKPSFKLALLFGILASAAGLTKASGLLLAIVPPTTCLLSGRIKLLLDKRLWVAPLPVALTVIPWILATRHITQEGMLETPVSEFII
ncbi:MAG: hypothetical protein P8J87_16685, partial [Verrucomicrobiales bacterium]|nr:hypothetical protein [Verrucomicrobiales bacterium]